MAWAAHAQSEPRKARESACVVCSSCQWSIGCDSEGITQLTLRCPDASQLYLRKRLVPIFRELNLTVMIIEKIIH